MLWVFQLEREVARSDTLVLPWLLVIHTAPAWLHARLLGPVNDSRIGTARGRDGGAFGVRAEHSPPFCRQGFALELTRDPAL